jgi:cytochrome P450
VKGVAVPPGPHGANLIRTAFAYARDPFIALETLVREYGDVVRFIGGPVSACVVNRPDFIESILVADDWNFVPLRPFTVQRAMQDGLFTSQGELHRHQRHLLEHTYDPGSVARFGDAITSWGSALRDEWRDGQELDLEPEIEKLMVYLAAEILFGRSVRFRYEDLVAPALVANAYLGTRSTNPLSAIPELLPLLPANRQFWGAMRRLDRGVNSLIRERRHGTDIGHSDFVSTLLEMRDEEGREMPESQVRDEVIANYTTGNAVTVSGLLWTWYLLAKYPVAEAQLHAEVDDVLKGKLPTVDDLPRLTYTRAAIKEAMRLYPPAWTIGRRVMQDYELGDFLLPAGSIILLSPYVTQRDARFFTDPLEFTPQRWMSPPADPPQGGLSYFPFSAGPRGCLGEHLAWMEMVLLVATLAQRWRLRLSPGYPLQLLPLIALRPKFGMHMRLEKRPMGQVA